VFRGYINYYSFVHNYNYLVSLLSHILKGSCAKLLAAKFTLKNQRKVYKKFGNKLRSLSGKEFVTPKYGITLKFNSNSSDKIDSLFMKNKSITSLENLNCIQCGSKYKVEIHHIRAMKDLNPNINEIDKLMIKMNRKQISLCRECHMKKHNRGK